MYKAIFEIAYKISMKLEGYYSNSLNDKGGETVNGISRVYFPEWAGWEIVDELKSKFKITDIPYQIKKSEVIQELTAAFYKNEFWDKSNCGSMPQIVANEVFDTGINQGRKTAIIYLQKSLNLLNRDEKDYKDIDPDGSMGNNTKLSLDLYFKTQHYASRNFEQLQKCLLRWLNFYQLKRIENLAIREPSQEKWIMGWTYRC